ncbi:MAG: YitT family protein [Desulfonauticus sp.]|nr:YitT family protein [Desulfonauticus sp.]
MNKRVSSFTYTVWWNLILLTISALLIAISVKGIAIHHHLISGGVSGLALILHYLYPQLKVSYIFFTLNIPIFILGYIYVSRRFFLYSLYGMVITSAFLYLINLNIVIKDVFLATIAFGCLLGAGLGLSYRSLGSIGGTDIIAIILYNKFNLRIGQTNFFLTLVIFCFGLKIISLDLILYSLMAIGIASFVGEYFLGLFSQRKMVIIIANNPERIVQEISDRLHRGATYLYGQGAFRHEDKKLILTVVDSIQLKRLEEIIFSQDPQAFVIEGNTLNVLGKGFSKRKLY